MGAQNSKTEVLKEVLNNVSIDVINRNSSNATGYIDQKNELEIIGNSGGNISGINQINSSIINVSAISESVANGDLQSDLIANITERISQEAPAIGYSANKTEVKSVVSNVINSNITNESIQNITSTIMQSNQIKIIANTGTDIRYIIQANEAELILELINTTNSEIISKLQTTGALEGDLTQTTKSFLDFGLAIGFIFAGLGFLFLVGGKQVTTVATNPAFLIALVVIIIIILIAIASSGDDSKDDDSDDDSNFTSNFFGGYLSQLYY
jgi:hypothetical protein